MRTFVAIILANAVLMVVLASGSVAQAQKPVVAPIRRVQIQPANDNVMRVHGGTQARPQDEKIEGVSKPDPLSPKDKLGLTGFTITPAVFLTTIMLTPAHPVLADRGALSFHNPYIVYTLGNQPYAAFRSQADYPASGGYGVLNDRDVMLSLDHLTVGKHYMIDITVNGGETYYVTALPGDLKQTFSGTNHVMVLWEAGTDYAEIFLSAKTKNLWWMFHSAEITRVD